MKIAQISDLHVCMKPKFVCMKPRFGEQKLNKAIHEINNGEYDLVLVTGDITNAGYKHEYVMAKEVLDKINVPVITVPGNHDARNNGKQYYHSFFGDGSFVKRVGNVKIIGLDSVVEELNDGHIGHRQRNWLKEQLDKNEYTIVMLHHHILPVPGSGRERNILTDGNDLLKILLDYEVNLVLMGHKHVSNELVINKTKFVNAGAVSHTVRNYGSNNYNIIDIACDSERVTTKFIYDDD